MPSINLGHVKGDKGTSVRYRGTWNDTAGYVNDESYIDMVTYDGSLWICNLSNSGVSPDRSGFWDIVAQGQKNSRILWSGYALPGSTISFNVPKDCFHNEENTLTLVIEGYMYNQGYLPVSDGVVIASLSFPAASHDFPYQPYTYGDDSCLYIAGSDVTNEGSLAATGIKIRARKVTDTRYATCDVQNDTLTGKGFIITCVSAYVPSEA